MCCVINCGYSLKQLSSNLALRHFVRNQNPKFLSRPPESLVDLLLSLVPEQKRLISSIYSLINSTIDIPGLVPRTLGTLSRQLRQPGDGQMLITVSQVLLAVNQVTDGQTLGGQALLLQDRGTRYKAANIENEYSGAVPLFHRLGRTLHMFWFCSGLATFWTEIFKSLSKAYNTTISPEPLLALFGAPLQPLASKVTRTILAFTTLLARRLILLNWKHPQPPSYSSWVKEVLLTTRPEKLRFSLNGSLNLFETTWRPLLNFIEVFSLHTNHTCTQQPHRKCCQLGKFLARFSDFSDPLSNFISKKRLVTNLATYSDHQGKGEKYIIL